MLFLNAQASCFSETSLSNKTSYSKAAFPLEQEVPSRDAPQGLRVPDLHFRCLCARNGHGCGSPSGQSLGLRALLLWWSLKALCQPQSSFFFLGSFTVQRGRCSGHPCQKQRKSRWCSLDSPKNPGVHKVLCLPGRDQPVPTTSRSCAGTFLAGHGVLLNPLQMEQMSPPFPDMRQCGFDTPQVPLLGCPQPQLSLRPLGLPLPAPP